MLVTTSNDCVVERQMLGVADLEPHVRMPVGAPAEGDGLRREVDADGLGAELLGQQRHRSAAAAADVEDAPAAQVGGADELVARAGPSSG